MRLSYNGRMFMVGNAITDQLGRSMSLKEGYCVYSEETLIFLGEVLVFYEGQNMVITLYMGNDQPHIIVWSCVEFSGK